MMDALSSETVVVFVIITLGVVMGLLTILFSMLMPMLHDSVSKSNLARFYDAVLPVVKDTGASAYETAMAKLMKKAEATDNPFDEEMLAYIMKLVDERIAAIQNEPPVKVDDTQIIE